LVTHNFQDLTANGTAMLQSHNSQKYWVSFLAADELIYVKKSQLLCWSSHMQNT